MPKNKRYKLCICKECGIDFFVTSFKGKFNCPKCADWVMVEFIKDIWMERNIIYKRNWTKEEDELLLLSAEQGYAHREIAEALDRTKSAVAHRLVHLRKREGIKK